jgi:hypothetical protein
MTTVTTRQELIDALSAADLERWTKRSIYHDVTSGYTFGAANRDDLLTRKRKYPLYTYTMPDVFQINIDGELLQAMVKNAQQRVRAVAKRESAYAPVRDLQDRKVAANQQSHARVGDERTNTLAEYGWVDYLAGGPGADRGDGGRSTVAQAPQRRGRPSSGQPPARQQTPDATGSATGAVTTGLV